MNSFSKTSLSVLGILAVMGMSVSTAFAASFTSTQVAQHAVAADCWAVLNSKVYNLTPFIAQHPGGEAIIISQCGKDATATFNSGPHSASTINALNPYLLGDLATATVPVVPPVVVPVVTPTVPVAPTTTPTVTKVRHASERSHRVKKNHRVKSVSSESVQSKVTAHSESGERNDD